MTKQVLLRALIVMTTLLVLNGCKGSENASDATDDAALVLDAGQEPRETLRYKIAPGTTTTSQPVSVSQTPAVQSPAGGQAPSSLRPPAGDSQRSRSGDTEC